MTKGIASTQQQEQQQQQSDGQSIGSSSSDSSSAGSVGGGLVLKKGPWTAAEDAVLIEHVKKNGEGNWNSVQKNTGLARCGKSCRLRWTNHLRPNLKKGAFTPEEERLILKLHSQLGNKWARMATQLPGRTDNEIKNYWNTRIKHRIRQGLPLYPHDITPEHLPSSSVPRATEPRSNTTTQLHTQTPIQILAQPRPISQDLPQTPSSMLLSPQYSQHYLKSSFNNCLFYPSPSLACPASTFTNTHTTPVLASSPLRLKGSYEDTTGFSLSFLPISLGSSPLPSVPTPSQLPNTGSFQFSPLSCNVSSPQYVQTQLDSDRYLSSVSVFPSKSELPSSQLYLSQIGKPETDMKRRRGMYCSGSELLEDLLEEAQALSNENPQMQSFMNLQVEKLDVSLRSGCDWDARSSVNPSAVNLGHSHSEIDTRKGFGLPLVQEGIKVEKDTAQQNFTMQQEEDLSKLLNVFPSTLQREARLEKEKLDPIPFVQADVSKLLNVIPPANQFSSGYDSNSEFCNRQSSSYASAGADVTMGGLEMQQQIARSLPVTTAVDKERTPVPSSWDNVSRIW
ncbi:transcription factor MYB97-like isoform X2 [Syzygium oleosum]|uniref:transcription factor MYB97-like isoform X2 n=1 Tax=Syzygium oleosum TaxID=219896 RepID=UPI0024BAFBC5|nr:transcription factor MYB97-like isoform X2 [Syzygium oleosum]